MEKCMNGNVPIYAFDIIDENRIINIDLEKEYRLASNKKRLTCCGCGSPIIFRFKNLDKMKPHFSHYSSSSNEGCTYDKETEEHIEGKKILLDHMRKLYPDILHEMRYHIKSINRYADLYFKSDDEELIIEFHRSDLDINAVNDKFQDYRSLDLNITWILSQDNDPLSKELREYNLSFFKRSILNDFNNRLIVLNVKNKEITLFSKIVYQDKDTQKVVMDRVFYKTYPLDSIIINLDGSILSTFEEELELAKNQFIIQYEEKLRKEIEIQEAKQKRINESRSREKLRIQKKSESRIGIKDLSQESFSVTHYIKKSTEISWDDIPDKNAKKKSGQYRTHESNINAILRGEKLELIDIICEGFESGQYYVDEMINILNIKIKAGNKDAKLLLEKFMSYRKS